MGKDGNTTTTTTNNNNTNNNNNMYLCYKVPLLAGYLNSTVNHDFQAGSIRMYC